MKKEKNKKINYVVLVLITIGVLYFSLKDNFNEVVNEILNVNIWFLLVSFILLFIFMIFRSYSMYQFCNKINNKFKYSDSFLLMLRTQFFNAITPFATGGQPYQLYFLSKNGIPIAESTSIILENFIVYQIALVFLGIVALVCNKIFHLFTKVYLLQKLIALGFLINTLIIVVMFVVAFSNKMNQFLVNLGIKILSKLHIIKDVDKTTKNWDDYIKRFHVSALVLLKEKKVFIKSILSNFLALCCLYLIPVFIIYSTGDFVSVKPGVAIVLSAYVMILGSFVPIPGGSGGLEYGFVSFYGNFIGGSRLNAIMLIWRFITYYFSMILGAIALNIKRVKK